MYDTPFSTNKSRNSSDSSSCSSRHVRHSAPSKLRRFTAWIAEHAFNHTDAHGLKIYTKKD